MKRVKNLALGLAGVAAVALGSNVMAASNIAGSKHDLTTSDATLNRTDGTGELCVFCHTPHGSNTSASVPLWNRAMSNPSVFTTYDVLGTSTLDGTIMDVGSVSLACLSCHDGTVSMDTLINAPGSGGYVAGGSDLPFNWTAGSNNNVDATGKLTGAITLIGTDLRNDHPVGVQYAGGGITATNHSPAPSTYKDPDFYQPLVMANNGITYWWIDTDANSTRTRADIILYTRGLAGDQSAGITTPQPFVECASCHDPHETEFGTFLRISNTGSGLCLACHNK